MVSSLLWRATCYSIREQHKQLHARRQIYKIHRRRGNLPYGQDKWKGDSVKIKEPLIFEFKEKISHSDKGDNGYSFAYDVCGLVGNIMNDGVLTNKKNNQKIIRVTTNETRKKEREREEFYIKTWNNGKGKCTFGDMNMKRHKDTPYRNDYPCGNKCSICNTFWID